MQKTPRSLFKNSKKRSKKWRTFLPNSLANPDRHFQSLKNLTHNLSTYKISLEFHLQRKKKAKVEEVSMTRMKTKNHKESHPKNHGESQVTNPASWEWGLLTKGNPRILLRFSVTHLKICRCWHRSRAMLDQARKSWWTLNYQRKNLFRTSKKSSLIWPCHPHLLRQNSWKRPIS